MKFGDAFTYVFQDQDWFKKLIIPGLVMLIPILGQIVVLGWSLKVTQNVIRNDPSPLPELDFGGDLSMGFKALVVSLVYSIPALVIYIPFMIITALAGNSGDDTMMTVMGIAGACFGLIMAVYGIAVAFVIPAAYARTAVEDSIGAGLKFGEVFNMVKKAFVPYLLVVLGTIVSSFIGSLGSIACIIGILVTMPYAMAVNGHLYGQAYMEAKDLQTL
jgi:hypothetical protein